LSHESSLASCYRSCLDLAASVPEIRTLAFCGVSTGIFGFPKRAAARIAVAEVRSWLGRNPGRFDRVVFVAFSAQDEVIYRELL
jgi:O-acetyl-ADP-ribose deacetylase (regulator of RNase III)